MFLFGRWRWGLIFLALCCLVFGILLWVRGVLCSVFGEGCGRPTGGGRACVDADSRGAGRRRCLSELWLGGVRTRGRTRGGGLLGGGRLGGWARWMGPRRLGGMGPAGAVGPAGSRKGSECLDGILGRAGDCVEGRKVAECNLGELAGVRVEGGRCGVLARR